MAEAAAESETVARGAERGEDGAAARAGAAPRQRRAGAARRLRSAPADAAGPGARRAAGGRGGLRRRAGRARLSLGLSSAQARRPDGPAHAPVYTLWLHDEAGTMTPDDTAPRLRALRGATTVDADTSEAIRERTAELVTTLLERNALAVDDIVSVVFTATPRPDRRFPGGGGAQRRPRRHAAPLLSGDPRGRRRGTLRARSRALLPAGGARRPPRVPARGAPAPSRPSGVSA